MHFSPVGPAPPLSLQAVIFTFQLSGTYCGTGAHAHARTHTQTCTALHRTWRCSAISSCLYPRAPSTSSMCEGVAQLLLMRHQPPAATTAWPRWPMTRSAHAPACAFTWVRTHVHTRKRACPGNQPPRTRSSKQTHRLAAACISNKSPAMLPINQPPPTPPPSSCEMQPFQASPGSSQHPFLPPACNTHMCARTYTHTRACARARLPDCTPAPCSSALSPPRAPQHGSCRTQGGLPAFLCIAGMCATERGPGREHMHCQAVHGNVGGQASTGNWGTLTLAAQAMHRLST